MKQLEKLNNKIKEHFFWVDKIYIYSENTKKQRINARQGLYKMIEDYEQKKIDIIIFEDTEALGSDRYIQSEILKMLLKKNIIFEIINEGIESTSIIGRQMLDIILLMTKQAKESNNKRSIMGNIVKDRKNSIVYVRHKSTTIIAKDEERLKNLIEKF